MKFFISVLTVLMSLSAFAGETKQVISSGAEFPLKSKEQALFFRTEIARPQEAVILGKYKITIKGVETRTTPSQLFTTNPQACLKARGIVYCPGDKIQAANGAPEVFTIAGIQVSPEGFFKRQNKIAVEYRKSFAVVSADQIIPYE